jgi:ATP adenylyltransferase
MSYIESASSSDACLFCTAAAAEGDECRVWVLERAGGCLTMLNAFPYTSGHVMVAPVRHVATLGDLTDGERIELMRALARMESALLAAYRPQGFNMGLNLGDAGGAGIPGHLHAHLVPRWTGDTNFMTSVAETRVLPEALDQTYERLKKALASAGGR